ncbi:dTDP-4-dehydrorhamnose reductase [uncultured Vagococcus sp.]|uniref:dTDP-4-dehydrorhamnose reductase n=1 Tax=uncultured Vagococcus sp. TaxID=189676 RepID=UPI0028D8AFDC|nr:dTDP-4-dehydrorhamnose reductase [uncultured Vagococcus sp.]
MTILITGKNGQLGTELGQFLEQKEIDYLGTDSKELDICNQKQVIDYFNQVRPTIVFHCAAYTAVDAAEDESKELNAKVNVEGTRHVAEAAESVGAILVYISTDYVFDGGKSEGEYYPEDETNPINQYGMAKLAGEQIVAGTCTKYYIIRTSWVYGKYGNNFVFTMQKLAKNRDVLTVVSDQIGRPTWTRTLAEFMLHLVVEKAEYGTYQLSNDESCSWYEFAQEILKNQSVKINPISSDNYPQKANRPKRSIMNLDKAKATGFVIPTWKEALEVFLNESD